ncbi:uncharacterized protein [Chelonus insularis]|uniref:uncharacterized protein n=1 Tax=Chelonus insularis TaxID=460826 RepID=UPI00158A216D|nr:uncharacterized protein LOC118069253 [Chelonus insularis]
MLKKVYRDDEKIPGECPYDRCAYKGCKNGKYRNFRKLFLFPRSTEPERLEKWLQNCGNPDIRKKAASSIRRSGVCADHFDPSCFSDASKHYLKRNSVPLPNYPPNLGNNSNQNNSTTNENKTTNENVIATNVILSNAECHDWKSNDTKIIKAPQLFEDFDDPDRVDDIDSCFQISSDISKKEISTNDDNDEEIPSWKKYAIYLSDDEDDGSKNENQTIKNTDSSVMVDNVNPDTNNQLQYQINNRVNIYEEHLEEFSPLSQDSTIEHHDEKKIETMTYESNLHTINIINPTTISNVNSKNTRTIIDTTGASVEMIRQLNAEFTKNDLIAKLKQQNSMLRKELRRMRNLERLRKQRKAIKTVTKKKKSFKEQRQLILDTIEEMDLSPVSKAIISLQLHTKRTPYTEEEKNLATEILLYSRSGFKKLKNAGMNFPSASSLKRWFKNIRTQEAGEEVEETIETEIDAPVLVQHEIDYPPDP